MSRQETNAKAILTQPTPSNAILESELEDRTGGRIRTTDWLTAAEAAHYLRVKARTLLLWARKGKVKAFALSGTSRKAWRFRKSDLDAALLESPVLPSEAPSVCPAERMGK